MTTNTENESSYTYKNGLKQSFVIGLVTKYIETTFHLFKVFTISFLVIIQTILTTQLRVGS